MNKPTQEQIRELWEWCGFKIEWDSPYNKSRCAIIFPDGSRHRLLSESLDVIVDPIKYLPPMDLNNLFEYAVPKLGDKWALRIIKYVDSPLFHIELTYCTLKYGEIKTEDANPALALFWAIWGVIH